MSERHARWFEEVRVVAKDALCLRAKCGSVIVSEGEIIGRGYNAPPQDDIGLRKCKEENYDRTKKPKYDLTCCLHAEWRAIEDALRDHPEKLNGATLYYGRLNDEGELRHSGEPFCTVCSRLALDVGIRYFGLSQAGGYTIYDTDDYNERSYRFHKK